MKLINYKMVGTELHYTGMVKLRGGAKKKRARTIMQGGRGSRSSSLVYCMGGVCLCIYNVNPTSPLAFLDQLNSAPLFCERLWPLGVYVNVKKK